MPVTSMSTLRADVGALVAPSMKGFIRRETCTAAVVIPTMEAEIDRGSMSKKIQKYHNDADSNKEHAREGNQRQDIGKISP